MTARRVVVEDRAAYLTMTAKLIRQYATAATPGPWVDYGSGYLISGPHLDGEGEAPPWVGTIHDAHDAAYVTRWSPPVALAVAAVIEEAAALAARDEDLGLIYRGPIYDLARTYRGDLP